MRRMISGKTGVEQPLEFPVCYVADVGQLDRTVIGRGFREPESESEAVVEEFPGVDVVDLHIHYYGDSGMNAGEEVT